MRYRADIDGLRAIAVLPVVLFHADFEVFSGGFVGVDIFFVISGYLITKIIYEEIRQERFSIVKFYERRVRRIFPALFTVLFASSIAGWLLMMPSDYAEFGKSTIAATLFASNILFWRETGYFDGPAEMKPLLHTWSLSVEEQFYIFFPIFLFLAYKWLKGRVSIALIMVIVVSFFASTLAIEYGKTEASFYLAPTRAWELLFGSILAVGFFSPIKSNIIRELSTLTGFILICWSVFIFTDETPFPGINALLPCLGAALIIHGGEGGTSMVGRALQLKPVVFIGLISYSLYLWHWPMLVFSEYYTIRELTVNESILIIALSVITSIISWHLIEQPFRRRRLMKERRALFAAATAVMSFSVVFGIAGFIFNGVPSRFPDEVYKIASFVESRDPRREECLAGEGKWIEPDSACNYGSSVTPEIAIWGDSHAVALIPGFEYLANKYNKAVTLFAYKVCTPVLGIRRVDVTDDLCPEYNEKVLQYLLDNPNFKRVILVGRYSFHLHGPTDDFGPAEQSTRTVMFSNDSGRILKENLLKKAYESGLRSTVMALVESGKEVILVYPVPETGYDIPSTLARIRAMGGNPEEFTRPVDYFYKRNDFVLSVLENLAESEYVHSVAVHDRLCNERDCIVFANGEPLYHDDDHLSIAGATYISSLFEPFFIEKKIELAERVFLHQNSID